MPVSQTEISKYPLEIANRHQEDPAVIAALETILISRRGWVSRMPEVGEHVVYIYSGGLDSTTNMDQIMNEQKAIIHPLFVRRSAKATAYEEQAAQYFAQFYAQKFPGQMMSLEVVQTEVPPLQFKNYNQTEAQRPKGHPMRNAVLQALGVQYGQRLRAEGLDVNTVLTGTVSDDGFPHSSLLALRCATLLACIDSGDWRWQVTSTLVDDNLGQPQYKKDLIKYAIENGIPLEKTRTCIMGCEQPDGTCGECKCRAKAFAAAGIPDPINYPQH